MEFLENNPDNALSLNTNSKWAITTKDNPHNPFKDFSNWYMFDTQKGYNTCNYLARIVKPSDLLSDEENDIELERAIDEIIKHDFLNIYVKVFNEEFVS